MKYKRHQKLEILIFCAIMASLSIVLDKFLAFKLAVFKFTLYGLPLLFIGIMFGSIPGLLVGLTTGIVLQLTSEYGITPTSFFWALAPICWGGLSGLICDLFKRKLNAWKICIIVVSASVGALLLNTLAMVMEGVLMNSDYYTIQRILTDLPPRIISCIILCPVYIIVLTTLYKTLKKYILKNEEQFIDEDSTEI